MEIAVNHIAKKYRGKVVLRDVSFEASDGMCIGILGSNGSGKSTLLSILAGIQRPDGGSFLCDGKDLLKDGKTRSARVGYVPQGTALIPELTGWDNLLLWYDKKDLQQQLTKGVLRLLEVEEFLHKPVWKLSGGMKKRLSIGCSMARCPQLLLLDEPTAALDLACKQTIGNYLRAYKKAGGILVLITHDPEELSLCDAWYILKDGVLEAYAYDGNIQKLVENM